MVCICWSVLGMLLELLAALSICAAISIISVRAVPAFQSLMRTAELKVTPQRASTSSRICSTFA